MAKLFIVVPLAGYLGLWISGGALFVFYFKLFHIPIDPSDAVGMIRATPAPLAMATAALCSFASFFTVTWTALRMIGELPGAATLFQIGAASVLTTIALDLLITVVGERIDVRVFPLNAMYLLAWLAIIPAVLAARR